MLPWQDVSINYGTIFYGATCSCPNIWSAGIENCAALAVVIVVVFLLPLSLILLLVVVSSSPSSSKSWDVIDCLLLLLYSAPPTRCSWPLFGAMTFVRAAQGVDDVAQAAAEQGSAERTEIPARIGLPKASKQALIRFSATHERARARQEKEPSARG